MWSMMFIIIALSVMFCGIGSIMLISQRMKQNHGRTLSSDGEPDAIRRLAEAVESLQGQVTDLGERMDFTERLLEGALAGF